MNKNFYITTPIFYPTGTPHIGTAYNVFIADTLARYYRQKLGKENVFFLTGTDEHGANVERKAAEQNISPQDYVDGFAKIYQDSWLNLNITNDYFIRTTNKEHESFIQSLIQKSYDNGDLYEGEYSGWYCESCEAYYKEEELVDGKCPNHPTKTPIFSKEKNYYFKLSKYKDWLLQYLKENENFIRPKKWYDYIYSLVSQGLQDIPVTRANVKWGVPVPWDNSQTIYVWYDALPNYISALKLREFEDQDYYNKFWPDSHHLVGKDILRFHAILWPAMLKSAGFPLPKQVLVHGFFTVNGDKIGKSNNNAIDPAELAKEYTVDGVRYALLSEFQLGNDGDFSFERLKVKYNSELANNFGNLLNRVIHLANQRNVDFNTVVPEEPFKQVVDKYIVDYHTHFENSEIFEAIQVVNNLCTFGNQYTNDNKPWELSSDATLILGNLYYLLKVVIIFFNPIIPESAVKAENALKQKRTIILFPKLEEKNLKKIVDLKELIKPIKIVKILKISQHPNADRLKIVRVDFGDSQKDVITGADNMKVSDLVPYLGEGNIIPGLLIFKKEKVVLKKKPLRGIDSDSMILAEDEIGLSNDHEGILILDCDESNIGKSLLEILTPKEWSTIEDNYNSNL